jgi:ankyrin repeat protein
LDNQEAIEILMEFIKKNDIRMVTDILSKGLLISNAHNSSKLLSMSVEISNNVEIFKALSDAGLKFRNTQDSSEALIFACSRNANLDMVKLLVLSGIPIDQSSKTNNGETLLISAINAKNNSIVEYALSQKQNLNIQDANRDTALIAAIETDQLEVVCKLIDLNADVNIKGYQGKTALMYVAHDIRRNRKLHSRVILNRLIKAGANPNIKNDKGDTPLMFLIEEPQILKECITQETDLELEDIYGQSALYLAAHNGFLKAVEVLINAGALPNPDIKRTKYNKLPLVAASGQGHADIVKFLIANGAGVNFHEGKSEGIQETALIAATKQNRIEIVKYLLTVGADVSFKSKYEGNALDLAINKKYPELAEIIARHAAKP